MEGELKRVRQKFKNLEEDQFLFIISFFAGDNPVMIAAKLRHKDLVITSYWHFGGSSNLGPTTN